MNAGLFIYFHRDPGQNIYFKVFDQGPIYWYIGPWFDGQDIYFKKLPAPPPSESTVRPLTKKKDKFQPFPNSTDCHTKHISHALRVWPSYYQNYHKQTINYQNRVQTH